MSAAVQPSRGGIAVFAVLTAGQFVSRTGSGLTRFALGVWIYQQTGSVTQFALTSFFAVLPALLVSPVAGAIVDRHDRKRVLVAAHLLSALTVVAVAWLLFAGRLAPWHIYALVAVNSSLSAFSTPALSATTPLLVPREHLARAGGWVHGSQAAAQTIAPVLAGVLMMRVDLWTVIALDAASFVIAVGTLLAVRIPNPPARQGKRQHLLRDSVVGWQYLGAHRSLLALTLFYAFVNQAITLLQALLTPMVLSFASAEALGSILSLGGTGMLAGSLLMGVWGGPRRRLAGVVGASLFFGVCLVALGLRPSLPLVAVAYFGIQLSHPISGACSQAILQTRVPPEVQGRVFATAYMLGMAPVPFTYLLSGPVAERLFEPLLLRGGALAGTAGRVVGVGPGRGIALMLLLGGVFTLLATVLTYRFTSLPRVEDPDPADEPREAPAARAPGVRLAG